ncbi:MAG: peptidase M3 [Planctomycetaceae bacterium]|nr:peptidase M3 [Planctomycetaceae bacterium]
MTDAHSPDNPLLTIEGLPPFDRIRAEHVEPAVRHILERTTSGIQTIEQILQDASPPTWENTIGALEELGRVWERSWSPVSHLLGVANSEELREAHESVLPDVVALGLRIRQSRPVYQALKALRDGPDWDGLSETQQRIIDDRIRDAELAGIALSEDDQQRFNEIATRLSQLSTEFSNHVLDATKAWDLILDDPTDVAEMPDTLKQLASQSFNNQAQDQAQDQAGDGDPETGPWRFTLDVPSAMPFLQHCRNRDLRERLYLAYVTRASSAELDNAPLIDEILQLRRERAGLLGFTSFAEMSVVTKMADVPSVESMFQLLRDASWQAGLDDLEDLRSLATAHGQQQPLNHWDQAFWSERLREERFDMTDEQLRPYFPLERVLDGLFALVGRLFGISVEPADGEAPKWHADVRFFRVHDDNGAPIAAFYLDPYSRPENKRGGAWMDECLARRRVDAKLQLPVAHLICNGTPPVGTRPSLMTFREVETLFHEFGHGLQHMLTIVDYPDASGINGVEWDAVELPSQFMENWCYHRPTLLGIARHFETGEVLPEDLFEKLCRARTFRAGSLMLRQLNFGMVDMQLHHQYDPSGSETVRDVKQRIARLTSVLEPLPEDRSLCAFQHIFAGGYAAGYYSYKWAEVLSADAFSAFEDAGLDNEQAVSATGRKFRDTVLASGGGRHPMDVFRDFRGREPSPQPLLRHNGLVADPDTPAG